MKQIKNLYSMLMLSGVLLLSACGAEDEAPKFSLDAISINDDEYTMGGTLGLMYSLDEGATFTDELPAALPTASTVQVKITNGTVDLTAEDFTFDWSASSVAPADPNAAIAVFTISENISSINVTVVDIMTLITSHRVSGEFSSINEETGTMTSLFTINTDGNDLTEIRGFTYHYNQQKFYVSQNTETINDETVKGMLYTIDPNTKTATILNDNADDLWYAIANWVVAEDDSLIALGYFKGDYDAGMVKVGTDGLIKVSNIVEHDICCGLGMLYDADTEEITFSTYSDDGEVQIDKILADGSLVVGEPITNLQNFPADYSSEWLSLKGMVKSKSGDVYGILFPYDLRASYFVKIDMSSSSVTYISTLGENQDNQYNMLEYVPNYTL